MICPSFIPESILKEICKLSELQYCDNMLNWKPLTEENMEEFKEWVPFVKAMLESNCLAQKFPSELADTSALPSEVQKAIHDAIPFYQKLYSLRIKV